MERGSFYFNAASVVICLLCSPLAAQPVLAAGEKLHWSYEGTTGPGNWGKLDVSFAACSGGTQQSPIDISGAVGAEIDAVSIKWKPVKLSSIVNNGHTIQVNTPDSGFMVLDGSRYNLLQFHFHHMSEHTLSGNRYPMEVHFVHKAAVGDGLAVIAVFLVEGAENTVLAPIWTAFPKRPGEASSDAFVDAARILPVSSSAFRYAGSLTTPPCSEIVSWTVLKEPVSASRDQIGSFAKLFTNNFRPVQPLNRRFILSLE